MRLLIYTLNATGALEEYKEAGRSVMKSLKARLLTAVVGISIILVLLFLGEIQPLVIAFAVAAVTAFMTGEYLHANKLLKKYFISVPCILFAAVIPIVLNTGLVYPIIAVFMIVGFAMLIYNHKQINYLDFAYAMFGTLLITFGMSAFSALCLNCKPLSFYFATIFHFLGWRTQADFLLAQALANINFVRMSALKKRLRAQSAE